MPGIVLGEVSSNDNPILAFFYQEDGFLLDVFSARFEVYPYNSGTLVASGTINMDAEADGGNNKATGYYAIPLDPATESMDAGCYELVIYYTVEDGDAEQEYSYSFEVLEQAYFRTSRAYKAYISSSHASLEDFALYERQRAISAASRKVDNLTGRTFFPTYGQTRYTMREKSFTVFLYEPVVGINGVTVESNGVIVGTSVTSDLDLTNLKVYNRHLGGTLSPDDRHNPRITFEYLDYLDRFFLQGSLPKGELNISVSGVFGYTDCDGSPVGETPSPLQEVVAALAYRNLVDPTGRDIMLYEPGRVRKAKTRDQELVLATTVSAFQSNLTGDYQLDMILAQYMRPMYVGAV